MTRRRTGRMVALARGFVFFMLPCVVLSSICDEKPGIIQCVALKNQFILPEKDSCNPLKKNCETGDLIDPRVADCHLELSGNTFHSLVEDFRLSSGYRCFPTIPEPDVFHRRNVGPSLGEPRCVPTKYRRLGSFVCGEHGTRCVCDAPKESEYSEHWWKNTCRWVLVKFSTLSDYAQYLSQQQILLTLTTTVTLLLRPALAPVSQSYTKGFRALKELFQSVFWPTGCNSVFLQTSPIYLLIIFVKNLTRFSILDSVWC